MLRGFKTNRARVSSALTGLFRPRLPASGRPLGTLACAESRRQYWRTSTPWAASAAAVLAGVAVIKNQLNDSTETRQTNAIRSDTEIQSVLPDVDSEIEPGGEQPEQPRLPVEPTTVWSSLRLAGRVVELAALGTPLAIVLPYRAIRYAATGDHRHASAAYKWIGWFLESAGCAFAKGAQWASMREDLFPRDLCVELRQLRDDTAQHPFEHTKREIESAAGKKLSEIFLDIDTEPVASGSVAQVHKATLRPDVSPDGTARQVAVKVRHPGVKRVLQQDLDLAAGALDIIRMVPGLDQLAPPVALDEFSAVLRRQADLRLEAANLRSFARNFRNRDHLHVRFPRPVEGMVSEAVLVETWETGVSIQDYVDVSSRFNVGLASRGYDIFLSMLLLDNCMHGDTHSGNIFVRLRDRETGGVVDWRPVEATRAPAGSTAGSEQRSGEASDGQAGIGSGRGATSQNVYDATWTNDNRNALHWAWDTWHSWWRGDDSASRLVAEMVVLDAGLVTSLSRDGRHHLRQLLLHIFLADGAAAADQFIQLSGGICADAPGFRRDMDILFANTCGSKVMRGATNVGQLIREMIALVNAYSMKLESEFANVVVSLATLEGLARSLDPEIDVIRRLGPFVAREITGVVYSAVREDLGIRSVEDLSPAATLARVFGGVFRRVPEIATGFWGAEG